MRRLFIFAVITAIFIFISTPSHAFWWMGYHKPEFKGKVIDSETKEPIEGAVVVVTYSKKVIRIAPESMSEIVDVRETLTDKEGSFHIPSYTTIIDPFAWESFVSFIIFKPGYGSYPNYHVSPPSPGVNPEVFFSTAETGTEGEIIWVGEKIKVTFGIVELPKLKTREEREKAFSIPNLPLEFTCYKIKNLIRLLNEEYKNLGYSHRERRDCNDKKE